MCSRPQYSDLTYMGGTRSCGPLKIILAVLFRVGIQAQILNLVRIALFMWPRSLYTDLVNMGGARSCGPMRIIFGSVIEGWCTSPNIKFDANRTFHVTEIPVYRFGLYGRYQNLWTDKAHFR